jgi:hypothetical protein
MPERSAQALIIYANVAERLDIYRSDEGDAPQQPKLLGTVNIFTGDELKPFLDSLSKRERTELDDCRRRALDEYRKSNFIDATELASQMLALAANIRRGYAEFTPTEKARLFLALQKLRACFKRSSPGKEGADDE